MSAGPDGVRDPVPNIRAALTAFEHNGFSGSPIRPVVISFSSFIPASTRGPGGDRLVPADPPARRRDPMAYGSSRCSIAAEAAWRFDRQQFAEVEIGDRP